MKFELNGEKISKGIGEFIYDLIIKLALLTLPLLTLFFDETIIQIMIIISWYLILNHYKEIIISTNKKEEIKK